MDYGLLTLKAFPFALRITTAAAKVNVLITKPISATNACRTATPHLDVDNPRRKPARQLEK